MQSLLTRRTALQLAGGAGLALAGLPSAGRAAGSAIRIAAVLDTTGSASVYGLPSLNGLRLAATEINARGGVHGHPLELLVGDGRSSPAQVRALFAQAVRDPRVVALTGPTLSSEAVEMDPIAQKAGLPVLAITNTVPGLTAIGRYIFRIAIGDTEIIPAVLKAAHARIGFTRVAILYDKVNAATKSEGAIFQAAAARLGLTVVATATFSTGARDFTAQLTAIKRAGPRAILVGALAAEGGRILSQRRTIGIPNSVRMIGANGLNTPSIIAGANGAAEGLIVGTAWYAQGMSARNRHFIAVYTSRYGHAPDVFAAQGYDGLYVLAAALERARALGNREAVRAALAATRDVPVMLGNGSAFSFTSGREANLSPIVQVVRDGRFVRFA